MSSVEATAAEDLPAGIGRITGEALRQRQWVALGVMVLPLLGTIEALRLVWNGATGWIEWTLFIAMYFVHMGGVTMGLHRLAAHRSFRAGPFVTAVLTVMGSMAGEGPVLFWVATHRAHHAHSDRAGDPHSPNLSGGGPIGALKGFWHGHMGWMLSEHAAKWTHYAREVLDDRTLMFVHRTYFIWLTLGFAIPTVIGGLLHGTLAGAWSGFIFGGAARMFLANQAAWCVGSVAHMWGGRPFHTRDRSANNWIVAIVAFGEGLQNNHHAFPSCYRHSIRWWEPDFSGWCLMIMRQVGLVWDTKFPNEAAISRALKR